MKIKTSVSGKIPARANVKTLVERLERGAMRTGMAKAARLMSSKAKSIVPVQSGLLKKSIRVKIKTNARDQNVLAIIGPSNRVSGQVQRAGRGIIETVRPAKYAHLVEFGTKDARAKPFMRPAYESTKAEATATFKREMVAAIPKVAASIQKRREASIKKHYTKK